MPSSNSGSQVVSGGQSVIASSTNSSGTSQGMIARLIASNEIPAIFEVTNNTTPTGGVIVPIIRLSTKISPNWMGSIPKLCRRRRQDRDQDQHGRERFHEAADDQQQHIHR